MGQNMYDKYLVDNDYFKFRAMISKIYNGEEVKYSVGWLKRKIQESYDKNRLRGTQYDDLMDFIRKIEFF